MKVRVHIQTDSITLDETLSGVNEEDIWQQARKEMERRAPFLARAALRLMDDAALWARITRHINRTQQRSEPVPTDAKSFLELGIRAGMVTRLE